MYKIYTMMVLCTLLFFSTPEAHGWYEKTHLAVAQITGYVRWYNAAGADIAKLKAGRIEYNNHYFSNPDNSEITAELVLSQVKQYNDPADSDGHLYGAIIGALRGYEHSAREFKYAEHHIAYCVHYVGDLSQPLHNVVNDEFNLTHHDKNDGTVDGDVLDNLSEIRKYMHPVSLRPENFEQDLAGEIARIANFARYLALRLKKENRDMTREEAYRQLGHSASLLHAILQHVGKLP
jgi:hypothetical protein